MYDDDPGCQYVVIEKRAVEVNAFADELDAVHGRGSSGNQGAMTRRATTHGQPTSAARSWPAGGS